MAVAIQAGRAHSRHVSRINALAGLAPLVGRVAAEQPQPFHDDVSRSHIAARTLASYWAMRVITVARKASDEFKARSLLSAAADIDPSVVRVAKTETVEAFNAERQSLYASVAKLRIPGLKEQWRSERDKRTCDKCAALDGETVDLGDSFSVGSPPLHPNCQCWTEVIRAAEAA